MQLFNLFMFNIKINEKIKQMNGLMENKQIYKYANQNISNANINQNHKQIIVSKCRHCFLLLKCYDKIKCNNTHENIIESILS